MTFALRPIATSFARVTPGAFTAPAAKIHHTAKKMLLEDLKQLSLSQFPKHPFSHKITNENACSVMKKYWAMSQAFPYVQAGAYKDIITKHILENAPVSEEVEKTFVVGSFLNWDECGGYYLLANQGTNALPQVLETKKHFHSNLLRQDMATLFQEKTKPHYDKATKVYLLDLMNRLGAHDPLQRGAGMVAFEMHAERMISSLWDSISRISNVSKDRLEYFSCHVGGDDPAEAYHVEMTQKLVQGLVKPEDTTLFIEHFLKSYAANVNWCDQICEK